MLKAVLIFLAGVLVGANAVYFLMARGDDDRGAAMVFERERTQHAELPVVSPPTKEPGPVEIGRSGAATPAAPSTVDVPPLATPPSAALPPVILPPATPPAGAASAPGLKLIVPVRGITPGQLDNTFEDARGQDRVHEAIDIMAPRGTPVLAVADGKVEKLFASVAGGLTLYQFEPVGRYAYYYAHLDGYADGVIEGKVLKQGEVIGYVGSTGNASEDAPHLHFGIFVLGPGKRWWEGTAINPYPILTGKQPRQPL